MSPFVPVQVNQQRKPRTQVLPQPDSSPPQLWGGPCPLPSASRSPSIRSSSSSPVPSPMPTLELGAFYNLLSQAVTSPLLSTCANGELTTYSPVCWQGGLLHLDAAAPASRPQTARGGFLHGPIPGEVCRCAHLDPGRPGPQAVAEPGPGRLLTRRLLSRSAYGSSPTPSTESTPTATSASAPARARWAGPTGALGTKSGQ